MKVSMFTLVLMISSVAFAYGWDEFELEGLLGFKKGLTNSSSLSNWMLENSHQLCTSWEGITCNNVTGHVEEILLSGLEGVFNPEISKLRFLIKLELVLNFLEGVVPPEIGLLASLKTLNLSGNGFTGEVPPELCRLTALEILDLSHNGFVGQIPEKVGMLKSLRHVNLSGNRLNGRIPPSLGDLVNLEILDLSHNGFVGQIPKELGMLKSLTQIDLSWNQKLNGSIPPSLGDLVNLEILDLSNNGFVGQIPKELGMLKSLTQIDLSWNTLNGSIPPSLGDLVNLDFLDLSFNGLVGQIPKELGMLKSLRHIDLSSNSLNGSIPPSLGDLVNLEFLRLPSLPLTGAEFGKLRNLKVLELTGEVIPQSIVNFSSLEDFSFSFDGGNESPIGNFPASFDKLNNLAELSVRDYNVQIPEVIGNFSNLRTIFIRGIRGSIPRSIFHLPHLWIITFENLVDDSSYWPFPGEVWNMTSLTDLRLRNVSLTGRLPDLLGSNSTALRSLDLSNNHLLGEVPAHVWQIMALDLSSNAFTGTIPTLDFSHTGILSASNNNLSGELSVYNSSGDSLWLLDLSDNMLTGEIPNDIGRWCKELEYLILEGNRLQGNIPSGLANCTQLSYIELGKNQIQGKLDIDFTNFTSLEIFSIPDNNLEGEFPVLGSDSSIFIIDIKGNRFSGQIPAFVAQMKDLRFLIMRENLFHGSFPPWLSSMRSLRILDLSHNRLTGNLPSDFGQQLDSFKSLYGMSNDSVHNLDLWVKGHEYEYRNLEDMTLIDLSSNMLNGEIPMSIGSLSYLRSLNLSHNSFSGKIPESLSNLTRLENLDLSNNELTGIIPETFKNLDSLGVLNLSWNKLEGRIPFEGHMTTFDDKFDFEGNSKLCGKPLETECSEVFHQPLDGQYSLVQNQKFIIWGNENISPFGFVLGFVAGLIIATWLIATKM